MTSKTDLHFQIVKRDEFRAVGLKLSGPYSALSEMGNLWATFAARIPEISAAVHPMTTLGITNDRPTDFTYYAAVEVSEFVNVPGGMETVTVPAQTYAVFTHRGTVATAGDTIAAARETLDQSGYSRDRNAFWLEVYDARFNPDSEASEFEYHFPILEG